uniref:PP1-binding domain-containing protein n=1 Tax=Amphiprion percula TaxID=161767 RepID=A0A3P8S1X5_AMPPE
MNTAGPNGEQKEKMLSSSEEAAPSILNESLPPLNFSGLTPSQFGISIQSFTPASSDRKDKSRLAQIKARRRSNIGARGSPETNSLIRFMAQQKMKTPPTTQTPELVRSSPFLPRVTSTLRQKMASFQSLMDVEESDACDPMPTQDSNTGGCIKTRDYLSGEACSKSRKYSVFAYLRIYYGTGEEDSTGMPTAKKEKKRVRFGGPLSPEFFDKDLPPSTPLQKGGMPGRAPTPGESLQLRSVLKTPQRNESITPQSQPNLSSPTVFGASPELAMPRNCRMSSEGEETEEKDGKVDKMPGLNLHLPDKIVFFNNLGVVTYSHLIYCLIPLHLNLIMLGDFHFICVRERGKETIYIMYPQANCLFPQQPEESEPVKRSTRSAAKSASGKMKMTSTAARRWNRDVDRSLYGSRAYASKNPTLSPITERLSFISQSPAAQQTLSTSFTGKLCNHYKTLSYNESMKQLLILLVCCWVEEKMLSCFSFYCIIFFITYNELNSVATSHMICLIKLKALECSSQSHSPEILWSSYLPTDPNQETRLNPEMATGIQVVAELPMAKILETASQDSFTSSNSDEESATGKGRRLSGLRVRRGGLKKRNVSVADGDLISEEPQDQTGAKTEQHCEERTTTSLQVSMGSPSKHTVPEQGDVDTEELCGLISADIPCIDSDEKSECYAPTSDCSTSAEESNNTEPAQRETINSSVRQEQQNHLKEHQTSHEGEEKGQGDQTASQQGTIQPSSVSPEEGAVDGIELAPWQAEFNFDDVFKPVPTRGQRSVRRSLRNRSKGKHGDSAGLAWLPRTSPDSNKEARRRTRGRLLSAALPAQPSLPEEAQTTP